MMSLVTGLQRDWRFLSGLFRTPGRVRSIEARSTNLVCDDLEAAVDRWRSPSKAPRSATASWTPSPPAAPTA